MSDFWTDCLETFQTQPLGGLIYRIVESQKIVATRSLVDDAHEQQLLEELLERSKPPLPTELQPYADNLDYLLWTPFRYPPLRFGSRFSSRFEPSLFYAARSIATTLAEAAYYRFFFWSGMSTPPASGKLETSHTVFATRILTAQGARLQAEPFVQHQQELTSKTSYQHCQELGAALREAGIKAFEFVSARDQEQRRNVALFTPEAFKSTQPESRLDLVCTTNANEVLFLDEKNQKTVHPLADFLVAGKLPQPAA